MRIRFDVVRHLERVMLLALATLTSLYACGGRVDDQVPAGFDADASAAAHAASAADGGVVADADAPSEPTSCAGGSVTFMLKCAPGWLVGQSVQTNAPAYNWLSVSCQCGKLLVLTPNVATTTRDCSACPQIWGVGGVDSFSSLPASGITQMWDGLHFDQTTCGASLPCVRPACVAPGHYEAQMCACARAELSYGACLKPVCVTLPFDYPSTSPVVGVLPGAP